MPFETLPEFPQGGVARAESGNMGIPPEAFTQALQDPAYATLTARRPEDAPAVRQVLDTEVDTLSRALGHQGQPPAQPQAPAQPLQTGTPPQAPAPPWADTAHQQPGADLSKRPLEERIHAIQAKYGGNFERLAEAHAHADAARTRAQQTASQYRGEFSALDDRMARIEAMLQGRPAETPQYGARPAPAATDTPETAGRPLTADEFFNNPEPILRRVVEETTDRVVKNHLLAYTSAQAQHEQQQQAEQLRQHHAKDIEELRPIMDEIYYAKPWLYDRLPENLLLTELIERARERQAAMNGVTLYREVTQGFGGNGIPANAAPGTAGALPQAGGGQGRRPAAGAITDYSNTPAMNRLWRSRSDSRDEMKALTDILKERGVGEDIPI